MHPYHTESIESTLKRLQAGAEGLDEDAVSLRRQQQGFNELTETVGKTPLQVFLEQFKDFLVIILIAAALISAFLGKLESALVIVVVVLINAALGTAQHLKAEQSLKSLKALSSPVARVLRSGIKQEIPSRELLVGDVLYLEAGDYVSADGRILENFSLMVNESSLTGESESVHKTADTLSDAHAALGDRLNMVFSGSFVTYGRATVVVTAIGMGTEIGRIANLLETAREKKTPLQANLDSFGQKLAVVILAISALILALNTFRGQPLVDSFMFAVSLAVAAIPEALSSIVTIVLALGTQKMSRENAIVRKLHAVESLGSISVICSDKTGTLTQNRMTVQKLLVDDAVIAHDGLNHDNPLEKNLVIMSLLCNDAVTHEGAEIGDPTEVALVNLGEVYGLDELKVREEHPRIGELPFDSGRKLMSTVNRFDGKPVMITKGALDVLLDRSDRMACCGGVRPLTADDRALITQANHTFSDSGLRVLAFAYKDFDETRELTLADEDGLTFLGLIAMIDPPRAESAEAVAACLQAGITPVMITGDHKITVSAIAREIGILQAGARAMEGQELDDISDEELVDVVRSVSVYARVSPEHKIRIVRAWQAGGRIVAMTGDGVNDAPALKQADIGIAMGITGTEVAKDASAMVLTDDNFSTIVKAIANGRNIYANITSAIRFLLSGNTAGILSVLYASLTALPVPFAPVHLLFINLLTDSLPAIAIGMEPHNPRIMNDKPRDSRAPIINRAFSLEILAEGLLIALVTMAAFHIGLAAGDPLTASTMAFATLCLSRLLHGFNCRSRESLFRIGLFTNRSLWMAVIGGFLLLESVLRVPALMGIFEVASLTGAQHGWVYGLSLVPLAAVQLYKGLIMGPISREEAQTGGSEGRNGL